MSPKLASLSTVALLSSFSNQAWAQTGLAEITGGVTDPPGVTNSPYNIAPRRSVDREPLILERRHPFVWAPVYELPRAPGKTLLSFWQRRWYRTNVAAG